MEEGAYCLGVASLFKEEKLWIVKVTGEELGSLWGYTRFNVLEFSLRVRYKLFIFRITEYAQFNVAGNF